MEWENLICNTRLGCEENQKTDNRNSYWRDYDRIVFSKEFRQLQTKTQVVPFPVRDGTHTRLTHSLETASVGRSLGALVAKQLQLADHGIETEDIVASVAAACLAHDIGNPPLGHSGEDAIKFYFSQGNGNELIRNKLSSDQCNDFYNIEGNAIGFNILTNSDPRKTKNNGGYGLTYTTLSALVKYPNRVYEEEVPFSKKHGILYKDICTYKKIAKELSIKEIKKNAWARHPLAYLTEAADDICYGIMDLEDGYKNKVVSFDETRDLLENMAKTNEDDSLLVDKITDSDEIIGYLRSKSINALIMHVSQAFCQNDKAIMDGSLSTPLISLIPESVQIAYQNIKDKTNEKIIKQKNILFTEASGFVVLPGLLDILMSAAFDSNSLRSKKIRDCLVADLICANDDYQTILNIVKYICLMTDNYAVKLYRELTGIQLPNY